MASATSEATSSLRTRPSPFEELPRLDPCFKVSMASRREICQAGTKAARSPVATATMAVKARTRTSSAISPTRGSSDPKMGNEYVDAVHCGEEPENAPAHSEQETFRERLLHQAPAARAESGPQGDLLGAAMGAREEQIGQVRAGDEEDERDRA